MKIIKSHRKTLSLKIDETGEVIIKAPLFVTNKTIEIFVNKHIDWINEKQKLTLDRVKNYHDGEKFMFLGTEYELKYSGNSKKLVFDGNYFYLDEKYREKAKDLFIKFYKFESIKYIEDRLYYIADIFDISFNKFKISSAKTRWGSCSSTRNLSFSYRLVMAPVETIDYVIVHELSHLKEMNHSKNFRNLVQKMMTGLDLGDYKIHKKWLKQHGNKLIF
ncbi:MAG: SprT family zinc-dependent metalloprotease [Candidatus Gracilibacteria bacterium]|nr:SprT family zinc-dependent metalloprotease [Candidatus Gracilibacteria bacterium]